MNKFIWIAWRPFRNHRTEKTLTDLIYKCIDLIENCPGVKVEIDWAYITITTPSSIIKLWNANRYYAWLCRGDVNGKSFFHMMPSRAAQFDFKECLKKAGYNIHVRCPLNTVSLGGVGC